MSKDIYNAIPVIYEGEVILKVLEDIPIGGTITFDPDLFLRLQEMLPPKEAEDG